jgi:hypothetical protein
MVAIRLFQEWPSVLHDPLKATERRFLLKSIHTVVFNRLWLYFNFCLAVLPAFGWMKEKTMGHLRESPGYHR